MLGVDAGTSSIPYLASWSQQAPIDTIEQHAKLIDRLARRIETHFTRDPHATPAAAAPAAAPPSAASETAQTRVPA